MKKKGIIITVALVLVAAILALVFVLLFKDKNTKSMAEDINSAVTTGYLNKESSEYKEVYDYLEEFDNVDIGKNLVVTNYKEAYEAYTTIILFFNNQAPFMEHTKTYSKNRKKIASALKSAQKNADKMEKMIKDTKRTTSGSETWERVVWNNYKKYVEGLVSDTMKACELLAKVYSASVASNLLNNDLTDVIFMAMRYFNNEFRKGVTTLPNLGGDLKSFAETTLNPSNIDTNIIGYQYKTESGKNLIKSTKQSGINAENKDLFLNGRIFR